jgi:uncharacterized protein YqfB (UPF0267 family)
MLLMKKRFFGDIRAGLKMTTLRYWRCCRVRPGSVQTVPGLGKVRIEAVKPVEMRRLADEDARADGFASVQALRRALSELYPRSARKGRKLYLVRFTYLPAQPPAGSRESGASPRRKAGESGPFAESRGSEARQATDPGVSASGDAVTSRGRKCRRRAPHV